MSAEIPTLYVAEPPAAYLHQPPIVVDCSVMIAALFEEEVRAQAISLMAGKKMYAPNLLDHELVHVAVKKMRSGWPAARPLRYRSTNAAARRCPHSPSASMAS